MWVVTTHGKILRGGEATDREARSDERRRKKQVFFVQNVYIKKSGLTPPSNKKTMVQGENVLLFNKTLSSVENDIWD